MKKEDLMSAELTPMKKQYYEAKAKHPDCLLFFRLGDFYEMFDEDAKTAAAELNLTLTTRDRNKPPEQKSANFQRLLARQNEISAEKHRAYVGKTVNCLVDGMGTDGRLTARTGGNRLIHLEGDPALVGTWQKARITDSSTWALFGTAEG